MSCYYLAIWGVLLLPCYLRCLAITLLSEVSCYYLAIWGVLLLPCYLRCVLLLPCYLRCLAITLLSEVCLAITLLSEVSCYYLAIRGSGGPKPLCRGCGGGAEGGRVFWQEIWRHRPVAALFWGARRPWGSCLWGRRAQWGTWSRVWSSWRASWAHLRTCVPPRGDPAYTTAPTAAAREARVLLAIILV